MSLQKHDRLPAACLEARVNPFGLNGDFVQQALIPLNFRAARGPNLDEGETALIRGIKLKKQLEGAEALKNSFRVVHAIDANPEEFSIYLQLVTQRRSLFAHAAMRPCVAVFLWSNANGVWAHPGDVTLAIHRKAVPF